MVSIIAALDERLAYVVQAWCVILVGAILAERQLALLDGKVSLIDLWHALQAFS